MKVLKILVRELHRVHWIFREKIQRAVLRSWKNALGALELKKKDKKKKLILGNMSEEEAERNWKKQEAEQMS